MAIISSPKFTILWNLPVNSEDIVATRIYFSDNPNNITYDSPRVGIATPKTSFSWPKDNLKFIPPSIDDKTYVKLATVDSAGNISDLVPEVALVVPFDTTPPTPPENIRLG
jgi:hypothetical protein